MMFVSEEDNIREVVEITTRKKTFLLVLKGMQKTNINPKPLKEAALR
jgi:hypothetical protein